MSSGSFVLTLHAHLPLVLRHGEWPHGSDWICEAAAECYIPILNVCNDLMSEGITPKITIDISPILCEQLEDPLFKVRFQKYCDDRIQGAIDDERFFRDFNYDPHQIYLATWWRDWYRERKIDFTEKYDGSIIKGLKKLQDEGAIEIMTCGLTHGYFALLADDRCINLQVKAAIENYKKHFGREPKGIWVPECAYRPSYSWKTLLLTPMYSEPHLRPGIEQILAKHGIEYFMIDQKLTENARPLGKFIKGDKNKFKSIKDADFPFQDWNFEKTPLNVFNVSSSEETQYGTSIAFTRHQDIAMSVWSGETGYPGEPDYLDFHKKRMESLLRYWRVTDNKADMMYKTLYHPDWTKDKIDLHSHNFINNIENSLGWHKHVSGKTATVCTPFDAELFGHWWFEGPEFLRAVIKGFHASPHVEMRTASEEITRLKPDEVMAVPEGSWGANNDHSVWMNEENKWTWDALYKDEYRMRTIEDRFFASEKNNDVRRILTQAMKELCLAEASDWQFLITTLSAKDYAEQRFSYHHSDFNQLCEFAETLMDGKALGDGEWRQVDFCEKRNPVFPEMQLEWRVMDN